MAVAHRPLFIFFFLLFRASTGKVSLEVYYESLCPYCSNFIVNYLPNIFQNGLISIVDLQLVPFGNAQIDSSGSMTCQHGPWECFLNVVEACAISSWSDVKEHFNLVYCVERLAMDNKYTEWESCFQSSELGSQAVTNCYRSGYGEKLELQYATQTDALQPRHTYVPWVLVDGVPLYDDYRNFETYICKAYDGELPKACGELPLTISQEGNTNLAVGNCPVTKTNLSYVAAKKHKQK